MVKAQAQKETENQEITVEERTGSSLVAKYAVEVAVYGIRSLNSVVAQVHGHTHIVQQSSMHTLQPGEWVCDSSTGTDDHNGEGAGTEGDRKSRDYGGGKNRIFIGGKVCCRSCCIWNPLSQFCRCSGPWSHSHSSTVLHAYIAAW